MVPTSTLAISLGVVFGLYVLLVLGLVLAGRSPDAKALARFVPDCLVLFRRLLGDPRVPRRNKLALLLLLGYLAMPFDLIPDFIPVAGQLDDVILTALVLRFVLRGAGPELLTQYWTGPQQGAEAISRLAFGRQSSATLPSRTPQ